MYRLYVQYVTPKIDNPSPNGETDVLYITGEDMKYSYKISKNEYKFKENNLSI